MWEAQQELLQRESVKDKVEKHAAAMETAVTAAGGWDGDVYAHLPPSSPTAGRHEKVPDAVRRFGEGEGEDTAAPAPAPEAAPAVVTRTVSAQQASRVQVAGVRRRAVCKVSAAVPPCVRRRLVF